MLLEEIIYCLYGEETNSLLSFFVSNNSCRDSCIYQIIYGFKMQFLFPNKSES